ncbi:hypothetical protein MMC07_000686 [Pseudocyphellaria aurata]|nr:hypothetical protein [Pseudocyphellaria aurata]
MADPRRPIADQGPKPSQAGNQSDSVASPVGSLHPLQPRNKPPQPAARMQIDTPHLSPLRPQSKTTQQQGPPKIAIPRLHREPDLASTAGSSVLGDKHRVTHAFCKHCEDFKLTCIYEDGKRDRTRKRLESMMKKVDGYEKLLQDLSQRAGTADQRLIRKALEQGSTPDEDEMLARSAPRAALSSIYSGDLGDEDSDEPDDETRVSARAGSMESLDHINEDFNLSLKTRATGFIGKNSELTWIQRLKKETANNFDADDEAKPTLQADDDRNPTSLHPEFRSADTNPIHESTYHCDDLTISIPDFVDPNDVPPRPIADELFRVYLDTVHPSFPIIGRINFISQYQRFIEAPTINTGDSWKAILNLIFAIGAKYSHLVQAEWRGDERDHLIYFTRARMLGFNADSVLGHSDLQNVQITGLMSFYLTATNQINRAWAISGIAIRHACTLGLNMKNESKSIYESLKEIRYRVWWALCSNERLLSVMTGRPASFMNEDCAAPLPLPLDEEKFFSINAPGSNSHAIQLLRRYSSQESDHAVSTPSSAQSTKSRASPIDVYSPESQPPSSDHSQGIVPSNALYFYHHAKLSVLTSEVLTRLYRVGTVPQSWAQVQSTIADLDSKLDRWRTALPSVFDFTKRQRDQQFSRQRVSLGFFFYSVLMITSRPCLCRLNRKFPNQSEKAKDFNQSTAAKCVEAALGMLDLLPEEPNPIGLYGLAPWWCLVHHLVQAVIVLMLELSFRSDHLPQRVDDILLAAKKTVRWLRSMSVADISARRAWTMCDDMLRKVILRVGRNFDDLPVEPSMYAHDTADSMFGVFPVDTHPENMGHSNSLMNMYRAPEQADYMSVQPDIFTYYDESMSNQFSYPDRPS